MNANTQQLDADSYLKQRVEGQLAFYEKAATSAKRAYSLMQISIIVLGLLVPVVVNIPPDVLGDKINLAPGIQLAVTLMSLSLAVLNGLLNFKKYGDLWLSYRMTEELLKHEKFLFLTGSGSYEKSDSSFPQFVQTVESIISAEHNKFRSLIEDAKRPAGKDKGQ